MIDYSFSAYDPFFTFIAFSHNAQFDISELSEQNFHRKASLSICRYSFFTEKALPNLMILNLHDPGAFDPKTANALII